MRSFFEWLKRRFLTFDLLGDYFLSVKNTGWDLLWGASMPSIAYCAWWFFEIPPFRVTFVYFLCLIFISGYYLWRADHIRLTPKIQVREIKFQATPTVHPETQIPNGTSIYVQLLLKCEVPIEECIGNLREVRVWSNETRNWEETELNESLLLFWSHADEKPPKPITLRPKNERRLNIYFAHSNFGTDINVLIYPIPSRIADVFRNDNIFKFDILVEGKDCIPLEVFMRVQRGKSWDKPIATLVAGDYAENEAITRS